MLSNMNRTEQAGDPAKWRARKRLVDIPTIELYTVPGIFIDIIIS